MRGELEEINHIRSHCEQMWRGAEAEVQDMGKRLKEATSAAVADHDNLRRVVVEALGEFKGLVGRYFVTKASLLALMERSHELNASAIKDALGSAWDRGIIKHPSQIDRFLSNPSIQASMKGAIEKFFELEVGMSVDELEELSQKPRFTEVSGVG
jgi:hypothetical protein